MNLQANKTDRARFSGFLGRLIAHVQLERVAITGGIAIQLGMAGGGRLGPRDGIADLDLVAASVDAIRAKVTERFLVSHYHVVRPGVSKFMVQLVEPVSRIRIDVFPDLVGSLADARWTMVGEHLFRVLPLERIFEHKLLMISRSSRSAPIDPKHLRDALVLGDVLGRAVPLVATEALAPDIYGTEADSFCERCRLSSHPSWPLAPKTEIFELLGWGPPPLCHRMRL